MFLNNNFLNKAKVEKLISLKCFQNFEISIFFGLSLKHIFKSFVFIFIVLLIIIFHKFNIYVFIDILK